MLKQLIRHIVVYPEDGDEDCVDWRCLILPTGAEDRAAKTSYRTWWVPVPVVYCDHNRIG